MSTTVVPAPVSRAKRPVNGNAPKKQAQQQQAVNEDEARLALGDSESEAEAAEKGEAEAASVQSETSLGEFTFGAALADAAASSSLLAAEAEKADSEGFGQFGDGDGSTILLVGAIALVALGVVVLVGDGNSEAPNQAPSVSPATQNLTVQSGATLNFNVAATDPDGDALTFTAAGASRGTVTGGTGGAFTYTPNAGVGGTDTFTITVRDPDGLTATQTVNVAINRAPDLGPDQSFTITKNEPLAGTLVATDADGDTISYGVTTGPEEATGTLTVAAGGALTFTPATDFVGTTSFVVNASDGRGGSDTLTITVVVEDVPPSGQNVVIDNVTGTLNLSAAGANFNFLDDVTVRTDAVITGFGSGDQIIVTNPGNAAFDARTAYSYTASALSGVGGAAEEIIITYNAGGNFTQIVLVDAAINADGGANFVFDYASAVASVGFDFINAGAGGGGENGGGENGGGNGGDGGSPSDVVIDNATGTLSLSAAGGAFSFLDDVTVRTDAVITDFTDNDQIVVDHPTNAAFNARTAYSFTASNTTGGPVEEIIITYNAGGNFTQIVLVDAAINADGGANFVFDYASAVASMGFDFITIA